MRILNVRLGHACNSSSTHSLIFLPGTTDDPGYGQEYGWDNFTLASEEFKLPYIAQQVYTVLKRTKGDDVALAMTMHFVGVQPDTENGYVDHQSVWESFPTQWSSPELNFDFLKEFVDYLKRDGIVILGGNDNSDGHPLREIGKELPLSYSTLSSYRGTYVARRDEGLNCWVLFNRMTGGKIRMSFTNETANPDVPHVDVTKASAPELVDVKITDYCPYECDHCYQGSTKTASHADFDFLTKALDDLAAMEVFEVAYGGGEPTLHPMFNRLLIETKDRRIVPNFTTRNLTYLKENVKQIKEIVGQIAYSVDFPDEIETLKKYVRSTAKKEDRWTSYNSVFHERKSASWSHVVGIQHVVGSVPQAELEDLLKFCAETHVEMTLLGWKTTGRGSDVKPHDVDWKLACKNANLGSIRIDTALARRSDMSDIDPETYHTTEGSVSCYIDGVERKVGPSSYASSLHMKPYTSMAADWPRVRVERTA